MNDFSNLYKEILEKLPLCDEFDKEKVSKKISDGLNYLTSGYYREIEEVIQNASYDFTPNINSEQEITIKDIRFISLCEHHLLPFFGSCEVAYIPDKKIIGFSRVGKIIKLLSLKLQLQENFTREILSVLLKILEPKSLVVKVVATHTCMMINDDKSGNSEITTIERYKKSSYI